LSKAEVSIALFIAVISGFIWGAAIEKNFRPPEIEIEYLAPHAYLDNEPCVITKTSFTGCMFSAPISNDDRNQDADKEDEFLKNATKGQK